MIILFISFRFSVSRLTVTINWEYSCFSCQTFCSEKRRLNKICESTRAASLILFIVHLIDRNVGNYSAKWIIVLDFFKPKTNICCKCFLYVMLIFVIFENENTALDFWTVGEIK